MGVRHCFYEVTLAGGGISSVAATWLLTGDVTITGLVAFVIATFCYVILPSTVQQKNQLAFHWLYRHRDVLGNDVNCNWSFCREVTWPCNTLMLWSYTVGVTTYAFTAGVLLAWGLGIVTAVGWYLLAMRVQRGRNLSGPTGAYWDKDLIQMQGQYWDQVKQELYQREAIEQLKRDRNRRHGR